jgi:hypothetical protein
MGEIIHEYKILVEKVKGKRPLWKPMQRWEDNVNMALRDTECDDVN